MIGLIAIVLATTCALGHYLELVRIVGIAIGMLLALYALSLSIGGKEVG